jgi:hypothetical protein
LGDADAAVRRVALRAAALSGHPAASEAVDRALGDPDSQVRAVAYEAGAEGGAARSRLLERLTAERDREALRALAGALARGTEPAVQEALLAELLDGAPERRSAVADALRGAEASWIRERLLPLASAPGPHRRDALYVLGGRAGDPAVVQACVALYEAMPRRGDPAFTAAALERAPCDEVLSRIAGRRVFGDEALGVAREWLARRDDG